MAKKELSVLPRENPDIPATLTKATIAALQALQAGTATPDQQQRALQWIINEASGAYMPNFYTGGEDGRRSTDFALGRAFVGQQIVGALKINPLYYHED